MRAPRATCRSYNGVFARAAAASVNLLSCFHSCCVFARLLRFSCLSRWSTASIGAERFHVFFGFGGGRRSPGLLGPEMFRIAPFHFRAGFDIGAAPEAGQILCDLHWLLRRR